MTIIQFGWWFVLSLALITLFAILYWSVYDWYLPNQTPEERVL